VSAAPPDRHPELIVDPDAPRSARPLHLQIPALAAVVVGGMLGAPARYGIGLLTPSTVGRWPTATFTVNMVGAFLLGVLLEALARSGADTGRRRTVRLLLGSGFLGAFTTYSTLAVDTARQFRAGDNALAFGYALTSVVAGLLLAGAGIALSAAVHLRRRGGGVDSVRELIMPPRVTEGAR
jgi:CrcB protein